MFCSCISFTCKDRWRSNGMTRSWKGNRYKRKLPSVCYRQKIDVLMSSMTLFLSLSLSNKLMLVVFFSCSLPYIWRQDLSLNPKITSFARPAGQASPRDLTPCVSSVQTHRALLPGAWALNSGPLTSIMNTLLMEATP